MSPGEVEAIRTTDPMVIVRAKGGLLSILLIRAAAYDTFQQRKIIPIQEIKAADMEMIKSRMVSITNRDVEEKGIIMNPITASVEAQCILIAKNRKMKEEEKIKKHKGKCSEKGCPYESAL